MIELVTGYLDAAEMDIELVAIVEHFRAIQVETVFVSFGFGCQRDQLLQADLVPIGINLLLESLADHEARGIFELGESNVMIEGGGLAYLVCHEHDIHCSGEENSALRQVRRRWARDHEGSQERRNGGRWRRIRGRPDV